MNQTQTIALYQPMLLRIAEKIVGCVQDAEDIVHDTFVRWLTTDKEKIRNTKAYLIKSVTNNCLNHLEAIKRKKNELLEDWHISAFIDKQKEREIFNFDLENEVSAAWDILHKKLEPIEKSVYVLREVFNFDYEEIQEVVDKKTANCRKLFSRAKEKLSEETSKFKFDLPNATFLESFKKASTMDQITDFVEELKQDIQRKLPSLK